MQTVEYNDEYGGEQHGEHDASCEYCGSPVNRDGESIPDHGRKYDALTRQAVCRIVLRLWDKPDMCEAVYFRVVLGKTATQIARKLGKSRQAVSYLLTKGAIEWPQFERLLFERNNETNNTSITKPRKRKGKKLCQPKKRK